MNYHGSIQLILKKIHTLKCCIIVSFSAECIVVYSILISIKKKNPKPQNL